MVSDWNNFCSCVFIIISLQSVYNINKKEMEEYKELFLLFDKDENGVLSFAELSTAMKTFGLRIEG